VCLSGLWAAAASARCAPADVAGRVEAAGFVAAGAAVVRLGRADVRALWWWQLKRATAERLLLDAVAGLGPGWWCRTGTRTATRRGG